jgi:hypothetical protein
MNRLPRIKSNGIYVAWQPTIGTVDGVPVTVRRGQRVRGDHPLVVALRAEAFVEEGTPEADWPSVFAETGRMIARDETDRRSDQGTGETG